MKPKIYTSPESTYVFNTIDRHTNHHIDSWRFPGIFLAGPIQGAVDWQDLALEHLLRFADIYKINVDIFNPRRSEKYDEEFTNKMYYEQVDWEQAHIDYSFRTGVLLFWLDNEVTRYPGRSFAQTTRFELGEAVGQASYNPLLKLVVGYNDGFSGIQYIKYALNKLHNVPVATTLATTCEHAILTVKYGR